MWRKIRRRPQLALVAVAGILVLIVAILAPIIGPRIRSDLQPPAQARAARATLATPHGTVLPSSTHVHTEWSDSTALVTWDAIPGAAGYVVTLIRSRDLGIMERYTVPATQLAGDAQGIWPGESYQVAIQPLGANGAAGTPEYSVAGMATPISRSTYNGFLDEENVADGQIDPNLWDVRLGQDAPPNQGGTFVNDQLHYHIEAGDLNGDQTFTSMRTRVPVDWTGRTATIHGEVDLKGDFHNWFAAVLTPTVVGGDHIIDFVDRGGKREVIPQLELFDDQAGVHLVYASGGGSAAYELGPAFTGAYKLSNVRDALLWQVSASHITVTIDGQTAFDVALPQALSFTRGYLTLMAEDYPGSTGGNIPPTACDGVMHDCNVWHLDNWGFDAASGQMPTPRVYFASGCGPYPSAENQTVTFAPCGTLDNTGYGWDSSKGDTVFASLTVETTHALTSAGIAFDAKGLLKNGQIAVAINGGPYIVENSVATDANAYSWQPYLVPINPALLRVGQNTITFRDLMPQPSTPQIADIQLETLSSDPYSPPPLPPDPTPKAYWR
ncbi:MAG: hypothetical protein ACRDHP_00350 [Ktedonobacterales bacterium]